MKSRCLSGVLPSFVFAALLAFSSFAFEDDYLSSNDDCLVRKNIGDRLVYIFTNTNALAKVVLKRPMTLEEALVVGGGGAGGCAAKNAGNSGSGGGGGGGFVHTNLCAFLCEGSILSLRVGAGGNPTEHYEAENRPEPTGGNGGCSLLSIGSFSVIAYGGGGGAGAHGSFPGSGQLASSGGVTGMPACDFADDGEGVYFTSSQGGRCGYLSEMKLENDCGLGGGGAGGFLTRHDDGGRADGAEGRSSWITGVREVYGSGGGAGCGHVYATSGGLGGTHAGSGAKLAEGRQIDADAGFGGGGGGRANNHDGFGGWGGSGTVVLSFSIGDTTKKSPAIDCPGLYPYDSEGFARPAPVVRLGSRILSCGTDYEVEYFDNGILDNPYHTAANQLPRRWAWVRVVGKPGTSIDGVVRDVPFMAVKACLVDLAKTDSAAGDSWGNATTLEDAMSRINENEEIWLKEGSFVRTSTWSLGKAIVVRGGFAGDDDSNLAKRERTARTELDGNDAMETLLSVSVTNGTSLAYGNLFIDEFRFEQLAFSRAMNHLVECNGKGSYAVRFGDCDFKEAVVNSSQGSGLAFCASGDTYSPVQSFAFDDCRFTDNGRLRESGNPGKITGVAIGVFKKARLRLNRCFFTNNGVPRGQEVDRYITDSYRGSCIWAKGDGNADSKVVAVRAFDCRFVANRIDIKNRTYGEHGGAVCLTGRISGDTLFRNCLFAANECSYENGASGNNRDGHGGTLILNCTDANQSTVTVDKCTFAYNIQNSRTTAAGLTVLKGRLYMSDSIFSGNVVGKNDIDAADLQVGADGHVEVKRTLFPAEAETEPGYIAVADTGYLAMSGIMYGEAHFVTGLSTFVSALETKPAGGAVAIPKTGDSFVQFSEAGRELAANFDFHLLSKGGYCTNSGEWHEGSRLQSPAVWREGKKIVNLGVYAETPEQSLPLKMGYVMYIR